MIGSNKFTAEILYMYIMLHTYTSATHWTPTDHHAKSAPWRPEKLVQGFLAVRKAPRKCHTLGSPREPGLLCQAAQRRKTRLSPQREGRASAAFPGSAPKQQRGKRQRRLHCTPLQPASCPSTRRSQETERFFARCFFTTNDGIKVFLRGRHGRSLDSTLKAGPLGGAGGSGC